MCWNVFLICVCNIHKRSPSPAAKQWQLWQRECGGAGGGGSWRIVRVNAMREGGGGGLQHVVNPKQETEQLLFIQWLVLRLGVESCQSPPPWRSPGADACCVFYTGLYHVPSSGSDSWTPAERRQFNKGISAFKKDFFKVQKQVCSGCHSTQLILSSPAIGWAGLRESSLPDKNRISAWCLSAKPPNE